ncbi:hypothetical protein BU15DRAFT_63301 [Melanogaster broomeanus]|nr:hypothetical protein BU15DRAFT_63301 [Melanogaster broomeanus]
MGNCTRIRTAQFGLEYHYPCPLSASTGQDSGEVEGAKEGIYVPNADEPYTFRRGTGREWYTFAMSNTLSRGALCNFWTSTSLDDKGTRCCSVNVHLKQEKAARLVMEMTCDRISTEGGRAYASDAVKQVQGGDGLPSCSITATGQWGLLLAESLAVVMTAEFISPNHSPPLVSELLADRAPYPINHPDPLRFAVLAVLARLMCTSLNRHIVLELPHDSPAITKDFKALNSCPKVYETRPEWVDRVAPIQEPVFIRDAERNKLKDDGSNVGQEFKTMNIIVQMPHPHFVWLSDSGLSLIRSLRACPLPGGCCLKMREHAGRKLDSRYKKAPTNFRWNYVSLKNRKFRKEPWLPPPAG